MTFFAWPITRLCRSFTMTIKAPQRTNRDRINPMMPPDQKCHSNATQIFPCIFTGLGKCPQLNITIITQLLGISSPTATFSSDVQNSQVISQNGTFTKPWFRWGFNTQRWWCSFRTTRLLAGDLYTVFVSHNFTIGSWSFNHQTYGVTVDKWWFIDCVGLGTSTAYHRETYQPSIIGCDRCHTFLYFDTADGCEILHHQKDGWNVETLKIVGCLPPINWWFGFRNQPPDGFLVAVTCHITCVFQETAFDGPSSLDVLVEVFLKNLQMFWNGPQKSTVLL